MDETYSTTPILAALSSCARGPRRDGLFALWLTVRVARDLCLGASSEAATARLDALERRVRSLSLPPALQRALGTAHGLMREATPDSADRAMRQLLPAAVEAFGPLIAPSLRVR